MDGGYANKSINLHREFITAENINSLFHKYSVPQSFAVLSIDIDFNDFWVWNAIDESRFFAAIVIVEFNSHISPTESRTVKYDGKRGWDGRSSYFGAGIAALSRLAAAKGYYLVYAESAGVNAYFVRVDMVRKGSLLEEVIIASGYAQMTVHGKKINQFSS